MKAQASGNSPLLTNEQQQWLTIQKLLAATHVAVRRARRYCKVLHRVP
jgi:hypothetical protein